MDAFGSRDGKSSEMLHTNSDPDLEMMQRCIALAESSVREGEYPFAAVIASNGVFLCKSANRVKRDHDVNTRKLLLFPKRN